jgi:hypothetical protein
MDSSILQGWDCGRQQSKVLITGGTEGTHRVKLFGFRATIFE